MTGSPECLPSLNLTCPTINFQVLRCYCWPVDMENITSVYRKLYTFQVVFERRISSTNQQELLGTQGGFPSRTNQGTQELDEHGSSWLWCEKCLRHLCADLKRFFLVATHAQPETPGLTNMTGRNNHHAAVFRRYMLHLLSCCFFQCQGFPGDYPPSNSQMKKWSWDL